MDPDPYQNATNPEIILYTFLSYGLKEDWDQNPLFGECEENKKWLREKLF